MNSPARYTGSALDLPIDNNGWTIFTPSSDTRIMYVSVSGNDSTGAVYNSKSFSDLFNPSLPKRIQDIRSGIYACSQWVSGLDSF